MGWNYVTGSDGKAYPSGSSYSAGDGLNKMTTTQRDALGGKYVGLQIYNSTTNKINFWNGTAWQVVTSS